MGTRSRPAGGTQSRSSPLPRGWEAWSPAHPKLYDLRFTVENRLSGAVDTVKGYFGMRQIEKRKDAKGVWRIFLNGEPTYLMGFPAACTRRRRIANGK